MNKIILSISIVMLGASCIIAGIDDIPTAVNDLKPAAVQTNAFTVRGKLVGIQVNAASPNSSASNTVALTCNGETLFSMAFTNSATKYPMIQAHSTSGSSLYAYIDGGTGTNAVFVNIPVAGVVTQKCTGTGPYTNDWTVKLIIDK